MQRHLNDILVSIYRHSRDNAELMSLLRFMAKHIRQHHDQGLWNLPLTNEKLSVQCDAAGQWLALQLDCRSDGASVDALSLEERAVSLAKLDLPDDYWRIFKHLYFHDQVIPAEFEQAVQGLRQFQPTTHGFSKKNIWLWDENSAQAMIVLHRPAKQYFRRKLDAVKIAGRVLWALPKVYLAYRSLRKHVFQKPVTMTQRVGVALHTPYWPQEKKLLAELGHIPVLIRFYAHQGKVEWQASIDHISELKAMGVEVNIALVQDRQAVLEKKHWHALLETVLPAVHDQINWCEVGHAVNRVKWGIWQAEEYAHLVSLVSRYQQQFPKLRLVGPAVIDFEWYRLLDFLNVLPRDFKFSAVTQHLYVDRRGAPESLQGKFSTLEKCVMGRAIAQTNRHSDDRYIISEVNWPVKNTGIHSPIGSPYTAPEWFRDLPGEEPETYANYLIRYLAITLCSGVVDQVCLWRLSAHGYGLIDDLNEFQQRPAFTALKNFLRLLGTATFRQRLESDDNRYLLEFQQQDRSILLAWCVQGECVVPSPRHYKWCVQRDGEKSMATDTQLLLTEQPQYFLS